MAEPKSTAYARVQMVVEVTAPGGYGADWTLDKVQEQVSRESFDKLRNSLQPGMRIIGEPTLVDVVIRRTA